MIKVIQPHAQEFSEPVAELIKISSRGIIGADKINFVKRAGAEFADKIAALKFEPGEIPVHLIAIGATEDYGPNRNGDGFGRETCRRYHDTFQKYARFYRDHANKNPAKSYGVVKASYYNEPMRRIELVCALNGTKEAADRNGGLHADKELEKLSAGKDIPVSMACKIPFDKCSYCGNKARNRSEYCDAIENGGHCKAGGLKHNIGKVLSDGHVLHADNPDPSFFDISHVFRPADRIAYVFGELQKAASHGIISGAELAEQMELTFNPLAVTGTAKLNKQLVALSKLAAAERELKTGSSLWAQVALAHHPVVQEDIAEIDCSCAKMASVFRGLVDVGVILSPKDFLALTVKSANASLVNAVSNALRGVFSELEKQANIAEELEDNIFYPADTAPSNIRGWAQKVARTRTLITTDVEKRAYLAAIRGAETVKTAGSVSDVSAAERSLAKHYAMYKIASYAAAIEKYENNLLTPTHCVLQNYTI
jgi:hypothetical protein